MLQMSQASKKIMVDSIASLSYLMHARKTYYYAHLMPSCKCKWITISGQWIDVWTTKY